MVEFLPPGSDFGTVTTRAAAILSDPTQLGFNSSGYDGQKNFDDRSGEFSIEVYDDNVQVAFFSDDGVSVQVTDMGEIHDPLGPATENLPGLSNLGKGQALPDFGQSIKLIPASLSANHLYKFEWQFRNTLYTGGGDIDGMKVFVFGGGAQLALAAPVVTLSPLDMDQEPPCEWDIHAQLNPPNGAKVFPGSLVTIDVAIREIDYFEIETNGAKTLEDNVFFEGDGPVAKITLVNATFEGGGAEMQLPMHYDDEYQFKASKIVKVKIPSPLAGNVTVTLTASDPAREPEFLALLRKRKYKIQGTLKDKPLTLTATWSAVPANAKLPTTITGIGGFYTTLQIAENDPPPSVKRLEPMWSEQVTRHIGIVYQYGPDLNSDNSANYEGIPVQETFGPCTSNFTDISLIKDEIKAKINNGHVGPALTFDGYLNRWITEVSGQATFIIGTVLGQVDCTLDGYVLSIPETMAEGFFKNPPQSVIRVAEVQRYFCNGIELTGSMPADARSSFVKLGAVPNFKQQVKPQ